VIKIIAYLRRNPALSSQEFRDYWTNVHVPLIKSKLPSLRHYAGCFPLAVPGRRWRPTPSSSWASTTWRPWSGR